MKLKEMVKTYRLMANFYRIDLNKARMWDASKQHLEILQIQLDKFNALTRFWEDFM